MRYKDGLVGFEERTLYIYASRRPCFLEPQPGLSDDRDAEFRISILFLAYELIHPRGGCEKKNEILSVLFEMNGFFLFFAGPMGNTISKIESTA